MARAWMSGPLQSPSQAKEAWTAVLAQEADDHEARLGLADSLFLLGDPQAALTHLDGLPETPEVDALRAKILLQVDPDAANTFARRRVADGGAPSLWLVAAQACEILGLDAETRVAAGEAVAADPLSPSAHYLLARSLTRVGETQAAREEGRLHQVLLALSMDPGGSRMVPLEHLRAVDQLMESMVPVPAALRRLRLEALINAGLRGEGREALAAMLAAEGRSGATTTQLADWSERLGWSEQARALFEVALDEAQNEGDVRRSRHRLVRHLRTADPAAAEELMRSALAVDPGVATHHCMLGELLVDRQDEVAAAASFERALQLAPWRADCRVAWARLRQSQGERRAVERILAAAPEPSPELQRFREEHGYVEP